MVRLFIDDFRWPDMVFGSVGVGWNVVRNADEAIDFIRKNKVDFISFDHDLGCEDRDGAPPNTGYTVAVYIEMAVATGAITAPINYYIHSANPVGAEKIRAAMRNVEKFLGYTNDPTAWADPN